MLLRHEKFRRAVSGFADFSGAAAFSFFNSAYCRIAANPFDSAKFIRVGAPKRRKNTHENQTIRACDRDFFDYKRVPKSR